MNKRGFYKIALFKLGECLAMLLVIAFVALLFWVILYVRPVQP